MENNILKLTNTVYKILDFFPESDPLKYRAKDKALAILDHMILIDEASGWMSFQKDKYKIQISEDIDILLGYLWIGKTQGWLNSVNCLIVSNEYEKIRQGIKPVPELTRKLPGLDNRSGAENGNPAAEPRTQKNPDPVVNTTGNDTPAYFNSRAASKPSPKKADDLSERQKRIIGFLGKNKKAQVMDLQTVLPDVTKRTIRRDLDELLEKKKITRMGDFNQVFYQIKNEA